MRRAERDPAEYGRHAHPAAVHAGGYRLSQRCGAGHPAELPRAVPWRARQLGRRGRAGCGGCRRSGLCARGASVHRCRGHKRRTAAGPVLRDHRTETEAGDGHSRLCRRLGAPRHPAVPAAAGRSGMAVRPRGVCRRSVPLREERAGESVHGPAGTAARSRHPTVPRRRRNGRQRSRAAAGI